MADDGIRRTTIRYSCLKKDHHRKAYDIVEGKSNSTKNEFIIQAILEKEEGNELAELLRRAVREELISIQKDSLYEQLRKIVREELAHISFVQKESTTLEENKTQMTESMIPSDAMDFMKNLG